MCVCVCGGEGIETGKNRTYRVLMSVFGLCVCVKNRTYRVLMSVFGLCVCLFKC